MVVAFSLESFDHPTNEVRGDPGLRPDGMSEFRVSGFSPRKWPTLATIRLSRRWGTRICCGSDLGHPPEQVKLSADSRIRTEH